MDSEMNYFLWDQSEISLRLHPYLWLAITNWDGTILFWDSQIDNEVVYEYIDISWKTQRSVLISLWTIEGETSLSFTLEIHN